MGVQQGFRSACRLLFVQFCAALVVAVFEFLFSGDQAAWSALIGGLVCILPNIYFAYRLFQYQGARLAKKILQGFYRGEAVKLILTGILFALVWNYLKVSPLPFMLAFIAAQMVFWIAPLFVDSNNKGKL